MNFLKIAAPKPAAFPVVSFNQARNMATLKEIQMRLKSIKNIGKITKSMKMISSTKLVRAQKGMEIARRYGNTSTATLKFLEPKAVDGAAKTLLVACSSDRGLCGSIHSAISKPIKATVKKEPEQNLIAIIGDKARSQISRECRSAIAISFNSIGKAAPTFSEVASIVDKMLTSGIPFEHAKVYYNAFKSVVSYELTIIDTFTKEAIMNSVIAEKMSQFEVEDDVIDNYAEFTFANAVFHALAEGHASEMSARRTAMENATKNADDMVGNLTMIYNRSRQATITNELVDIITGASAL